MKKIYLLGGALALLVTAWVVDAPKLLERAAPDNPKTSLTLPPREVPEFQLTSHRGEEIKLVDLRGKVWVANFIFSSCPGPCKDLTRRLRQIDEALGTRADVRIVSFSIDPKTDTPQTLAKYAGEYGASERWLFLTGPRALTTKLANEGFLLALTNDPEDFTHSDKIVVVDREGRARFWIDSHAKDAVAQTVKAVEALS